jgi:hypothetical protein
MIAAMRKLGMPEEQIQKIIETQAAMNGWELDDVCAIRKFYPRRSIVP